MYIVAAFIAYDETEALDKIRDNIVSLVYTLYNRYNAYGVGWEDKEKIIVFMLTGDILC